MIYFLRSSKTGFVKIGRTAHYHARSLSLKTKYGDLELLGLMSGGHVIEQSLHRQFADMRIGRTEWFEYRPALIEFIAEHTQLDIPDESTAIKINVAKYRTRLAELMKKHEMTRMDVVRAAGMSYPTVVNWETKAMKSLNASIVSTLLSLFNCAYNDLVYVVEEERRLMSDEVIFVRDDEN